MSEYENRRDAYIAGHAANIAWDYIHNVQKYEGQRDQAYLFTLMKRDLDSLVRVFKGFEKDYGL
jgi:hypothetical protein